MTALLNALSLQLGYNATLVTIGASLLGFAAGAAGSFLYLRKRALVSDAVAHATLPGIGLAFMIMIALGGDGRNLIGLLLGSTATALAGLFVVDWMTHRTRLSEDTAIGAVLSVFFGFGVVLLTIIQTLSSGRQAGLDSFLLGSTAGMLFEDALIIAVGGTLAVAATVILRRPMTIVTFDETYAAAAGVSVRKIDLAMMALVMAVTVIGLKIVGLILIVALLIIPPVAARFWTERASNLVWIAAIIGGLSGYVGSAASASAPDIPTGPIIALVAFAMFVLSLLCAPDRGLLAGAMRHQRFQLRVHRRQGLLALARGEPIFDPLTIGVLRRGGLIRNDRVATPAGSAQASKALRDERRWEIARALYRDEAVVGRYDGLTPIEDVLTPDEIADLDRRIGGPSLVGDA